MIGNPCRKGDLAQVIANGIDDVTQRKNADRFVTVVEIYVGQSVPGAPFLFEPADDGLDWIVTSNAPFHVQYMGADGQVREIQLSHHVIPDHHLRPIRDPGDDAVDEMVRRIEVVA